jgi:hypothetical protein
METLNICIIPEFLKLKKFFLEMYQQNVTFLVYISTVKPIRQPNSRSKARLSKRNLNSKRR